MELLENGYRIMAVLMWGIVSVAAGLTLASWLEWEGKQLGFGILLMVGLYGLILTRWLAKSGGAEMGNDLSEVKSGVDKESRPGLLEAVGGTDRHEDAVEKLLAGSGDLNEQEVRQRLDNFMMEQQRF